MSEQEHIVRLKRGDYDSFEVLYYRHHARLYNFVFKILRGDAYLAEEIVQRVFVKLWEVRATIDERKNLLTYLCTIAKNMFLNDYAHRLIEYTYREYILRAGNYATMATEEIVNHSLLDQLITELTDKMPPARRTIFIMSRREGKSNREISQILNITESTIESQLAKAINFLKRELRLRYGLPSYIVVIIANILMSQ
jgi:RNA polymerase sigma-70 factor (ECF subfamily)